MPGEVGGYRIGEGRAGTGIEGVEDGGRGHIRLAGHGFLDRERRDRQPGCRLARSEGQRRAGRAPGQHVAQRVGGAWAHAGHQHVHALPRAAGLSCRRVPRGAAGGGPVLDYQRAPGTGRRAVQGDQWTGGRTDHGRPPVTREVTTNLLVEWSRPWPRSHP